MRKSVIRNFFKKCHRKTRSDLSALILWLNSDQSMFEINVSISSARTNLTVLGKRADDQKRFKTMWGSFAPQNVISIKWSVKPHVDDTKWTISVLIMVTVYDFYSGSHDKLDLWLMIGKDIVIGTLWWFLIVAIKIFQVSVLKKIKILLLYYLCDLLVHSCYFCLRASIIYRFVTIEFRIFLHLFYCWWIKNCYRTHV